MCVHAKIFRVQSLCIKIGFLKLESLLRFLKQAILDAGGADLRMQKARVETLSTQVYILLFTL